MQPCYCIHDLYKHSVALQFCTRLYLNFDIAQAIEHARPLIHQCQLMAVFVSGIYTLGGQQAGTNPDLAVILNSEIPSNIHYIAQLHRRAVDQYGQQRRRLAIQTWLEILAHDPGDLLALKFVTTACFFIGDADQMVEICQTCMNYIASIDRYHVWAMLAFGLIEKGDASNAERYASRALYRCCHSPWAVHALCHVFLEQGRITEGMELLTGNDQQWRHHDGLSCHIYWHWALFSLYYDDYIEALAIYDQQIFPHILKSAGFPMDVSDAVSLLIRFDMADVDVTDRWLALNEAIHPAVPHSLVYPFTASHYLILSYRVPSELDVQHPSTDLDQEPNSVLPSFYSGLQLYMQGKFDAAFADLFNVISRLRCVGGSNAQRDVFVLICINAAMRCDKDHLALRLLTNRLPASIQNKLRVSASSRVRQVSYQDRLIEIDAFRFQPTPEQERS